MPHSRTTRKPRTKRRQNVSLMSRDNISFDSLDAGWPNATSSPTRYSTLTEKDPLDDFDEGVEEMMCSLRKRRNNLLQAADKKNLLIKLKFGDKLGNTPWGQIPDKVAEGSETRLHEVVPETSKEEKQKSRRRRSRSVNRVQHTEFKKPADRRISRSCSNKRQVPSSNKHKTPMNQGHINLSAFTVTPKMNPNTPMTVLRIPRQGEMAISMTGSPLKVSSVVNDEIPTVQVPLGNGTVMSLMPRRGFFNPEDIPDVDEITREHLRTLYSQLGEYLQ